MPERSAPSEVLWVGPPVGLASVDQPLAGSDRRLVGWVGGSLILGWAEPLGRSVVGLVGRSVVGLVGRSLVLGWAEPLGVRVRRCLLWVGLCVVPLVESIGRFVVLVLV